MLSLLRRLAPRRMQVGIGGLLIAVFVIALLLNWLRPMSAHEAGRIAERFFLTLPGADAWSGRYDVRPWKAGSPNGEEYWLVDFVARDTRQPLNQIALDEQGKVVSRGFAIPPAQ